MPKLNCINTIRKLVGSVIYDQNQQLTEYVTAISARSSIPPDWDLLLWTFPELREKYRQALIALHRELVPNHISAEGMYSKLWELFQDIVLNSRQYKVKPNLNQKLAEFCSKVKRSLVSYDIIYEIQNFNVGESDFKFGDVEIFKMTVERLVGIGLIKDASDVENSRFNEWVNKSVIKTEVSVSELDRAYESGVNIVSNVLETIRLIAVWGRLDKPDDEMFLWELGKSMTMPKVVKPKGTEILTNYQRGFRPFIIPMDKAINKGLEDQKFFSFLLDGEFPEDIRTRIFRAVKWISNAVTSNNMDYKVVYLCTVLEILLLPDHTEGLKGGPIALRQVLLGRGGYCDPIGILNQYERRSKIIHSGDLEITNYSSYWHFLICCFQVLRNIVNLSKQNPQVSKLADLLKIVENTETLQKFIEQCNMGLYGSEGINPIREAAESRLEKMQGQS